MSPELIAQLETKNVARQEILKNIIQAAKDAECHSLTLDGQARLIEFIPAFRDTLIEFFKEDENIDIKRCPKRIKPVVARIARGEPATPRPRPHLVLVKG